MKKILFVLIALFPLLINAQETSGVQYEGKIYDLTQLDKEPKYPGGLEKLYAFVNYRFRVPEIEEEGTFKVEIGFIVEADGTMSSHTIISDPGYGMGEEGLKVLKLVKEKWKPGKLNGKKVRAHYVFPIKITIKKSS